MMRIGILITGVSFFVFAYHFLKLASNKGRAIDRLKLLDEREVPPTDKQWSREEKKIAVNLLKKGLQKSQFLAGYLNKKRLLLRRAYLKMSVEEFLALKIVSLSFLLLMLFYFSSNQRLNIIVGVILVFLGFCIPDWFVERMIEKRRRTLEKQLCDGLMVISNSLKSGHGFLQAVKMMTLEVDGPVSVEFSEVLKEVELGISLDEAMENLTNRVDSEDLQFVTTALLIQRESGGNLSEILDNISKTIKGRIQLQRELIAASAQGKISATILSLIPVFLFFYVTLMNPTTHGMLIKETVGIVMLSIAFVMECLGIYFIRRILKIKF